MQKFSRRVAGYLLSSLSYVICQDKKKSLRWSNESFDSAAVWCETFFQNHIGEKLFSPHRGHARMTMDESMRIANTLSSRDREQFLNSCAENVASSIVENPENAVCSLGFFVNCTPDTMIFTMCKIPYSDTPTLSPTC